MVKSNNRRVLSSEELDVIEILFREEKSDKEIANFLELSIVYVAHIRTKIFNIKINKKTRLCVNCGKQKNITTFSNKHKGYEDWCVKCRRSIGLDPYIRISTVKVGKKAEETKSFKCIRCKKIFESPTWGIDDKCHFYMCDNCREITSNIERVGI